MPEMSKAKQEKELKLLRRKCLFLWKARVKERAGKKCEAIGCKKTKFLNAHHIESFISNKSLRFDIRNGICLCPRHHRFGWFSAHRSFCFVFTLLSNKRKLDFDYLLEHYQDRIELNKEFLLDKISKLELSI
uniref:Putative HNH endonuclease n=1 Tax=viral metagenome TaxID=1070528 RepID=A0A6M3L345_9ZZZZ